MAFHKFQADQLFTGTDLLDGQRVLITDESGIVLNILPAKDAGGDIQISKGILSPGFINCHCHLELSHMRGMIPAKSGMINFVLAVMQQRHLPDEIIYAAIESAENEMLQNGIIAVGDICNNTLTIHQKTKGRLYYHNFIEASGFIPSIAKERFSRSLAFFNEFAGLYEIPIESNSIVPHAPYSVSPELFKMIVDFPGNHILTMHNQECMEEEEFFREKKGDFIRLYQQMNIDIGAFKPSGKSSLQSVLPAFRKNQTLILVHNVTTKMKDIQFLNNSRLTTPDLFLCLCPNANQYIGNGMPDIPLLVQSGFPIVIGTDSLASNPHLSILHELKTLLNEFPKLTLPDLLRWATLNGAKALQSEKVLGSFEKGKRPGVILIQSDLGRVKRIL